MIQIFFLFILLASWGMQNHRGCFPVPIFQISCLGDNIILAEVHKETLLFLLKTSNDEFALIV